MATTKIILTQEVDGLGADGDIVEVKAGYARNLLIPRGWATRWTPGAQKQIETQRKARKAREIADRDQALALKAKLEESSTSLELKAGANGRLFGAVTPALVAEALSAATGVTIDRRAVALATHVKEPGEYKATVRLHEDITAVAPFEVVGIR
ncbi:50S ribosomal protein L9 [Sediminivirga luteola]|jgi:large subunit ribosomal protein L9|uniref:Large ribosomal subunit protein bL9 n=1 Tax=Sediminivirga luteola TaxID=1774748 RepID=A0A8J2TZN0_9MICO|nr:50S ribosomal protein L9 [Sediminivirga luteola]MCI2267082.1 50S ribosomal protein L9 [Sediminivirga luteola]GGA20336.1 50S ribosomal protein L9 [Sediminivirga luteola]